MYKLKGVLGRFQMVKVTNICPCKYLFFSSSTDVFIELLLTEECIKKEVNLLKYFENSQSLTKLFPKNIKEGRPISELLSESDIQTAVNYVETSMVRESRTVPNVTLNHILIYFVKNGNTNGVKAVQIVIKRYNISHFNLYSEYKHYLAEALWIQGKVGDSLKLFAEVYANYKIRPKVKLMLVSLFPLLISHHSEGTLSKTVSVIEQLSIENKDYILMAYLWKELFQSTWFADQQLAKRILEKHTHLLQVIQWMIPALGKDFLKNHKIDDFYRLIELTLEKGFANISRILLQYLFDYYYIHQNIERCSAVVKYSSSFEKSVLTEQQQSKYVNLLLKSKNSKTCKLNVKKPQDLKYRF